MKPRAKWPRRGGSVERIFAAKVIRLFTLGLALGASPIRADIFPATDAMQKAAGTPHFWQRDPRGGFENTGRDYCCPVAVSNSLVYLARHGFPALLPEGDGVQPQIDLIKLLASSDYFGTDPDKGTPPGAVLRGTWRVRVITASGWNTKAGAGWAVMSRRPSARRGRASIG
ncbi:MAG: hypothetical protein WDO13_00770 [Verrucomicrobiota bacterium]